MRLFDLPFLSHRVVLILWILLNSKHAIMAADDPSVVAWETVPRHHHDTADKPTITLSHSSSLNVTRTQGILIFSKQPSQNTQNVVPPKIIITAKVESTHGNDNITNNPNKHDNHTSDDADPSDTNNTSTMDTQASSALCLAIVGVWAVICFFIAMAIWAMAFQPTNRKQLQPAHLDTYFLSQNDLMLGLMICTDTAIV